MQDFTKNTQLSAEQKQKLKELYPEISNFTIFKLEKENKILSVKIETFIKSTDNFLLIKIQVTPFSKREYNITLLNFDEVIIFTNSLINLVNLTEFEFYYSWKYFLANGGSYYKMRKTIDDEIIKYFNAIESYANEKKDLNERKSILNLNPQLLIMAISTKLDLLPKLEQTLERIQSDLEKTIERENKNCQQFSKKRNK